MPGSRHAIAGLPNRPSNNITAAALVMRFTRKSLLYFEYRVPSCGMALPGRSILWHSRPRLCLCQGTTSFVPIAAKTQKEKGKVRH
jgi:hypothetical protein